MAPKLFHSFLNQFFYVKETDRARLYVYLKALEEKLVIASTIQNNTTQSLLRYHNIT